MRLIRVTPPAALPVSLAEMKAFARIENDVHDDDVLLSDLIGSAVARLDGRDGLLGRCLIVQTWETILDRFAARIELPFPPVRSVDAITFTDSTGAPQTLPPSSYVVCGLDDLETGASITLGLGRTWPQTSTLPGAVRVRFTAGYGESPDDVPEPIREAIKIQALNRFENRDGAGSGWLADLFEYRVAGC